MITPEHQQALNNLCTLYGLAGFVLQNNGYIEFFHVHTGWGIFTMHESAPLDEVIKAVKRWTEEHPKGFWSGLSECEFFTPVDEDDDDD
ncbi:MAG: hypothetical protein ACHQ9S_18715 [Candidatus Binatia bacterium]